MNLMNLMQFKESWETFKRSHPKFPLFLKAALEKGLKEGSVVEIHITTPEGKTLSSNIKLKASDLEMIERLRAAIKE